MSQRIMSYENTLPSMAENTASFLLFNLHSGQHFTKPPIFNVDPHSGAGAGDHWTFVDSPSGHSSSELIWISEDKLI